MKIHAWPTNNAEQFCGQRKEQNCKCEHLKKFCVGLHEILVSTASVSSFVIRFNVVEFILF